MRVLPRSIQFALGAAHAAVADAGWQPACDAERHRAGVAIGTGISGLHDILEAQETLVTKVTGFLVGKVTALMD